MLALKPNVGPTAKTSRISPMGCFMGQEGVVDGESSASSLVPSRSFSCVVREVGVDRRRSPSNPSRKEISRKESLLTETGFSIKGDTGVAFGKGSGIKPGSGGGAELRLGTNVLEGNNGGVGGWFSRENMTISFTVSLLKGDTQEGSLGEMAVLGIWKGAPPSTLWVMKVRPRPNHCQ